MFDKTEEITVVQLRDGRELYLRDFTSGEWGASGICYVTDSKIQVKSSNIALVIKGVSTSDDDTGKRGNPVDDDERPLVATGQWTDKTNW